MNLKELGLSGQMVLRLVLDKHFLLKTLMFVVEGPIEQLQVPKVTFTLTPLISALDSPRN